MNPFRKNKKPKNGAQSSETPRSFTSTFKSSKKNKKNTAQDTEPDLNLPQALPSDDDFRTSLIMPKLSARFSMLREQDDPATKVGKASDDSVILPKRSSRLDALGLAPTHLHDIDEVDSIAGRSSFARPRADSVSGSYGPDEDDRAQPGSSNSSIMKRSRPVEGNNLFGGRQKVFKIPVKQLGPDGETGRSGMNGRTFYEDDLPLSAFQRLRLEEREAKKESTETPKQDATATPETEDTTSNASANRTTYSSTASGPSNSRMSTAATSVDENDAASATKSASNHNSGILRNTSSARSRRLYGHGLAQAAHEQQSSTLHRLESLSRQRAGTPELHTMNRSLSRSSPSLRDRLHKVAITESSYASRPSSPSLSMTSSGTQQRESDSFREGKSATSSLGGISPLGPPIAENDESNAELAAAVKPEDRGKATAMGLFNKPKTAFDEFQFMHRQIKLRQNAQTPSLRHTSSDASTKNQQPVEGPAEASATSTPSGAATSATSLHNDSQHIVEHSAPSTRDVSPRRAAQGTFFGDSSSSSESEDDDADIDVDGRRSTKVSSTMSQESDGVRPGFRSGSSTKSPVPARESRDRLPEVRLSELVDLKPIAEDDRVQDLYVDTSSKNEPSTEKPDSPTLGPTGRLSGLVRTHLREDSDRSTMFPPPIVDLPPSERRDSEIFSPVGESLASTTPTTPSTRGLDSRFENENKLANVSPSSTAVPPPRVRPSAPNTDSSPPPFVNKGHGPDTKSPKGSRVVSREPSFEDELSLKHRRGVSTETQREREEFARELAERRRKVEEKLKSISEIESRSASPAPGYRSSSEQPQMRPGNAFSILKNKPSKSPAPTRHEPRDLKALGLGSGNASTPSLPLGLSRHDEEDRMPYGFGKHSNSSSPHIAARSRKTSVSRRSHEEELRKRSRSVGRVASPSRRRTEQDRFGLQHDDTSGRTHTRTNSYSQWGDDREELGRLEKDGLEEIYNHLPRSPDRQDQHSLASVPSSARPSVERPTVDVHHKNDNNDEFNNNNNNNNGQPYEPSIPAIPATSSRFRSGSRSTASSNQADKFPQPPHLGDFSMVGVSPRPSPIPSYCANPTPSLYELVPDPTTRNQASPSGANGDHSNANPQRSFTKRPVNKLQISQPTFVHSTSNVPVVGLPPGASLKNGMQEHYHHHQQHPPPVPPMNPRRRRQTTTHNFFGGFRSDKNDARDTLFSTDYIEDQSMFSDDDTKAKVKRKLRKMSSEGGALNQRTRADSASRPFYSPHAPPPFPPPQAYSRRPHHSPVPTVEGGMI